MKKYIILLAATGIFSFTGCSNDDTETGDERVRLEGVQASLGMMNEDGTVETRAIRDFVVNTPNDPTMGMTGRTGWNFDVQIYKNNTPYPYGQAAFEWNGNMWVPEAGASIYFPNYTRQGVAATLYPDSWTGTIAQIQNTADLLLAQDILKQNGAATVTVLPAHIPTITMRHGNSMIDFIIDNVDVSQISTIIVAANGIEYTPYKVQGVSHNEYLVILPVGVKDPEVRITTVGGARYIQGLHINSTQVNNCYCVRLLGLELALASITVTDWVYGTALSGDYSTETSYPTFIGPPGESVTLFFDDGQQQVLTFNTRGEYTIKPVGRRIVRISDNLGEFVLTPPIILRSMVIDLNPHLQNRT